MSQLGHGVSVKSMSPAASVPVGRGVPVEPAAEAAGDAAVARPRRVGRRSPAGRVAVVERAVGRMVAGRRPLPRCRACPASLTSAGGGAPFCRGTLRCAATREALPRSGFLVHGARVVLGRGRGWYLPTARWWYLADWGLPAAGCRLSSASGGRGRSRGPGASRRVGRRSAAAPALAGPAPG